MLDLVVLLEGGVSYNELREMPIPELLRLNVQGGRLSERIKQAIRKARGK